MNIKKLSGAVSISILLIGHSVEAAENGMTAYMPGSSLYTGAAIPTIPGYFGEVIGNYTRYRKNNGPDGNDSGQILNIDAYSLTFRGLWVTEVEVLGAKLLHAGVLPIVYSEGTVPGDSAAGESGHTFTQGDISISPFILDWSLSEKYSISAGLDISIPTGKYDKNEPINIGRNYWSLQPVMGFSYKNIQGSEFHVLARLMFNTKNKETDYTTGNEFNADISYGYNINDTYKLGLHGYIYKQLTDDKWADGTNIYLPSGFQSESIGVGPAITIKNGPAEFLVSWVKDIESKNRGQGSQIYLKTNFKF